jgi:AcrR family transcriptional regulator
VTEPQTEPRRAHTEQGLERKTQLLEAAAALFSTKGYSNTRIADICAAAGVAKGLVYWYFPTKEDLFAELVRTMRLQLRRAQATAMDVEADPVTRIRQGTMASMVFMAEHHSYFALLDVERSDDEVAGVLRAGSDVYADDIIKLVREAQQFGMVPDGDARLYATGIQGAVSSFSHARRAGTLDVTVGELAEFVGDWVVSGLTVQPAPSTTASTLGRSTSA